MNNIDFHKVSKVIKEASKNSEFYKFEEEKLEEVKKKVVKYKERVEMAKQNPDLWARCSKKVE